MLYWLLKIRQVTDAAFSCSCEQLVWLCYLFLLILPYMVIGWLIVHASCGGFSFVSTVLVFWLFVTFRLGFMVF